mgnify:CR=1 FL=1
MIEDLDFVGVWSNDEDPFGKAIQADPHNATLYYYRALHYNSRIGYVSNRERIEQAIRDLDTAISLDSTNARAYYQRAIAHGKLRNYTSEAEDYRIAEELDPSLHD